MATGGECRCAIRRITKGSFSGHITKCVFISLHALLSASGNPKMKGNFLGRLFVRSLPQQDLLPRCLSLPSGRWDPAQVSSRNVSQQMLLRAGGGLKPALKSQHLSVYQELSGEMSLIRAVGNLNSRDGDLSARAALAGQGRAGQDEQSPLPGLLPSLFHPPAFKGHTVLSL